MKGRVFIKGIALGLFLAFMGAGQTAYAIPEGCSKTDGQKALMDDAAKLEKAGKFRWAIEWYANAYRWAFYCGKGNPQDPRNVEIAEALKRLGKKVGTEEEGKGNLFSAAFWFDSTLNFADADRVAMNIAIKSEDHEVFREIAGHFQDRKKGAEWFRKKSPGYTFDDGTFKALGQAMAKRVDAFLLKENEAFAKASRAVALMEISGAFKESEGSLHKAYDWYSLSKDIEKWAVEWRAPGWSADLKGRQVVERAEKRGDTLYADDIKPAALAWAIEYFEMACSFRDVDGDECKKTKAVKDKANRLGGLNEKNGKFIIAKEYFDIADNNAKAEEMEELIEKAAKKDVQKMFRGKEEKKKFKQEQDDLEKELGL